jgi:hypothetical protein
MRDIPPIDLNLADLAERALAEGRCRRYLFDRADGQDPPCNPDSRPPVGSAANAQPKTWPQPKSWKDSSERRG